MPYSRGKPQKISARRSSDEGAVRPNGIPFFQMKSVESDSKSGREKEGNKERTEISQEMGKGRDSLALYEIVVA